MWLFILIKVNSRTAFLSVMHHLATLSYFKSWFVGRNGMRTAPNEM